MTFTTVRTSWTLQLLGLLRRVQLLGLIGRLQLLGLLGFAKHNCKAVLQSHNCKERLQNTNAKQLLKQKQLLNQMFETLRGPPGRRQTKTLRKCS